jgi:hypothetical protein
MFIGREFRQTFTTWVYFARGEAWWDMAEPQNIPGVDEADSVIFC